MTAINIFLTKKNAIVYSDTLATNPLKKGDKKLKPKLYTNKIFVLPQFKSVFALTGILQWGLSFHRRHNLLQNRVCRHRYRIEVVVYTYL